MTTSCSPKVEMIPAELAYQAEATTGEGSIWHPERHTLFWVDIEGQTLYEYHPDTKECSSWKFDRMVSTVVPETDSTVIIALQDEIVRVNLHDGHTTSIARYLTKTVKCAAMTVNAIRPDIYGSERWGSVRLKVPELCTLFRLPEPSLRN